MKADEEWLAGLKVGDKVAVDIGQSVAVWYILTITGLTPTQIITKYTDTYDCRFKRKDGKRVADGSMGSQYIEPVTDAIRASVRRASLVTQVRALKTETLTTEQLGRIVEILKEKNPE